MAKVIATAIYITNGQLTVTVPVLFFSPLSLDDADSFLLLGSFFLFWGFIAQLARTRWWRRYYSSPLPHMLRSAERTKRR